MTVIVVVLMSELLLLGGCGRIDFTTLPGDADPADTGPRDTGFEDGRVGDAGPRDAGSEDSATDARSDAETDASCACTCGDACNVLGECVPTTRIEEVELGANHSCASSDDGRAFCWGAGALGQLGTGLTTEANTPQEISLPGSVRSLAAGTDYACAVLDAGTLHCWGLNDASQLGVPDVTALEPLQVGSRTDWHDVTAGNRHTCATTTTGEGYCWGANNAGQATGSTSRVDTPQRILRLWNGLSAGRAHTCGIDRTSRRGYCWGAYRDGQLGQGSTMLTQPQRSPLEIGNFNPGNLSTISVGDEHSCAAVSGGGLRCWGLNEDGQIGLPRLERSSTRFPALIADGSPWGQISAGASHTCGLNVDGGAWCFGFNLFGQLGLGNTLQIDLPQRVEGSYTRIEAGGDHTCAIDPEGALWCWGRNTAGQLGLGHSDPTSAPQRVCFP